MNLSVTFEHLKGTNILVTKLKMKWLINKTKQYST